MYILFIMVNWPQLFQKLVYTFVFIDIYILNIMYVNIVINEVEAHLNLYMKAEDSVMPSLGWGAVVMNHFYCYVFYHFICILNEHHHTPLVSSVGIVQIWA